MRVIIQALALSFAVASSVSNVFASERPNVLMILVDDLKPALGCYGDPLAKTPNLDRFAKRAVRFRGYCNQAVCAPSRFTLMLGLHSTSTGLYGLGNNLRDKLPDAVTLPQYFAKHGYRTESLGKIFHVGHGNLGDPDSFQVEHFKEKVIEYRDAASTPGGKLTREEAFFTNQMLDRIRSLPRGAAFESPDVEDEAYADGRVAAEAIRRLKRAKARRQESGTPFFMAVGFARPHLPFSAPKKYWDIHDPELLPLAANRQLPKDAPKVAGKRRGEITNYFPVPEDGECDDALSRQLVHGYYASSSFVDAQIGKVLHALEELELDDRTLVVLWGDHGFHLGDLGIWTKHTNYEQANRIPIMFAGPGINRGKEAKQIAESVDIYPTLVELAGLPPVEFKLDGISLKHAVEDTTAVRRAHAYHAYPRGKAIGRAIRTSRYRLVEWSSWKDTKAVPEIELYDYEVDPNETRNVAAENPVVVKELLQILGEYPKPKSRK